jgi:hypothetical protein
MIGPYDPYAPPSASLDERPQATGPSAVSHAVVELLRETRPWVKLLAVLFFIGLTLAAIFTAVAFVFGGGGMNVLPLLLVIALYTPPAVLMWRYAASIARLQEGGGQRALEEALADQKSFWKYAGILAIVTMCLYALLIVFVFVVGSGLRRLPGL